MMNPIRARFFTRASASLLFGLAAMLAPAAAGANQGDCGQPSSTGATPKSSDALFVLKDAVGSKSCDLCICDVTNDGKITTSDALKLLKKAVGQVVTLTCPACVPSLKGVLSVPPQVISASVPGFGSLASNAPLGGLVPAPGVTVELVNLNSEGTPILPVVATTTSKADGSYKFTPLPAASSQTIVRANVGGFELRAFVGGNTVNLDPMSEFVVASAIDAVVADATAGLDKLTVPEINDLTLLVDEAGIDLSSAASSGEALTMLDDQTGGVYGKMIGDFATGTGPTPSLAGSFQLVALGSAFARSYTPAVGQTPSINLRSIKGRTSTSTIAVGGDSAMTSGAIAGTGQLLTEISGSTPQQAGFDIPVNASASLVFSSTSDALPPNSTLRASNHGALLVQSQGLVSPGVFESGTNFGLVSYGAVAPDFSIGEGDFALAIRQGSAMSNSTLSATYSGVQMEIGLEQGTDASNVHRAITARTQTFTMTFDGNGHLSISAADSTQITLTKDGPLPNQPPADPVVSLANQDSVKDPTTGLTYTLAAGGQLTVKSGSTVVATGAATPDANVVVLQTGDESPGSGNLGLLIATKRGSGMNTASGHGKFITTGVTLQLQHDTQPGVPDVSLDTNNRQVNISGEIGSFDLDGIGTVSVHPSISRGVYLAENSGVQTHTVGPPDILDAFVTLGGFTEGNNSNGTETHTYSVSSQGVVAVDGAGGQQGFLSPDGNVFLLPNSSIDPTQMELGVLIGLRKP